MSEDTFDPMRLVKNDDIREVNVKGVGTVMYRPLLAKDMLALRRVLAGDDDFEMFGLKATWTMLNKVYPEFTFEQFMKYSPKDAGAIISAILKDSDFLESSSVEQ